MLISTIGHIQSVWGCPFRILKEVIKNCLKNILMTWWKCHCITLSEKTDYTHRVGNPNVTGLLTSVKATGRWKNAFSVLMKYAFFTIILNRANSESNVRIKTFSKIIFIKTIFLNWEMGFDVYTLLCIKQITENRLYSTRLSALWWPRWEGNLKKRGSIHTYNWVTLPYSRN